MGKGKAKGWRPPAANDSAASLLLGSTAHLTGDTIASPVQLRQEGRALPKGHPNFGDVWEPRGGKGKGGKGENSATGANSIPVIAKPKEGWAPSLDTELEKPKQPPPLLKSSAKASSVKSEPVESVPKASEPVTTTSTPSAASRAPAAEAEERRKNEAMTEIERRRQAMLEREKAAQQTFGVAECMPDDPEARRLALQARREQAEAAARDAEARRQQGLAATAARAAEPDGAGEAERGRLEEEQRRAEEEAKRCREAEEEERAAKRPREGEAGSDNAPAVGSAGKPQSGAMQQGLQGWAERVNALAGSDPELVKKCRELVRKRILRAHAEGNLHAVNWAEEPVPTLEELQPGG